MSKRRPLARRSRLWPAPGGLVAGLAALVLSLRVVGAALALGPGAGDHAGRIPICTGTEIVWISLAEAGPGVAGAPVEPEAAPDPCPWFGLAAALDAPAAPGIPAHPAVAHAPPPAPIRLAAPHTQAAFFRPRAPPVPA